MKRCALPLLFVVLFLSAGCAAAPRQVRILSYNIHHGQGVDGKFDLARIAAVIRAAAPDLVALQEVDVKTGRAGGVDQAAALGALTGMEARFGKAMEYDGGLYGEAVLSRLPVQEVRLHPLPADEGFEPRAALAVKVRLRGGAIWFAGTHLDHTRTPEQRMKQIQVLNRALAEGPEGLPVILAGDFNAEPESPEHEALREAWSAAAPRDPAPTFPSSSPEKKIDYVFFRPADAWRVKEVRVLGEETASDHRPLLVVLERVE